MPNEQHRTLNIDAVGAARVDVQLGFRAQSVHVDNPTGQWWFIPSAQLFIPPYTTNYLVPALSGAQVAVVVPESPPGFVSFPLANERATFIFLELFHEPTNGYSIAPFTAPFSVVLQGAFTDLSGTIAVGAVSQVLAAANIARRYLFIVNLDPADTLWIQDGGIAAVQTQPSIPLLPNGTFVIEGTAVNNAAWEIIGPNAGAAYSAREM